MDATENIDRKTNAYKYYPASANFPSSLHGLLLVEVFGVQPAGDLLHHQIKALPDEGS